MKTERKIEEQCKSGMRKDKETIQLEKVDKETAEIINQEIDEAFRGCLEKAEKN